MYSPMQREIEEAISREAATDLDFDITDMLDEQDAFADSEMLDNRFEQHQSGQWVDGH